MSSLLPSTSPMEHEDADNNNNTNNTSSRPSVTSSFASQNNNASSSSSSSTLPTTTTATAAAASRPQSQQQQQLPQQRPVMTEGTSDDWAEHLSTQFEDMIGKPSREAIHSFFYPPRNQPQQQQQQQQQYQQQQHQQQYTTTTTAAAAASSSSSTTRRTTLQQPHQQQQSCHTATHQSSPLQGTTTTRSTPVSSHYHHQQHPFSQHQQDNNNDNNNDRQFVHHFWTTYDDILILSLFTQLGIVFRLASATWFGIFDNVFNNDSALFTNLPLNCLSCFFMGMLCSGERLMEIITTRFSPPVLQQDILHQHVDNDDNNVNNNKKKKKKRRRRKPPSRESSSNEGDGLYHQGSNNNNNNNNNSRSCSPEGRRSRQSSFDNDDNDNDDNYENGEDDNDDQHASSSSPSPPHHNTFWSNLDDSFSDFIQMPQDQPTGFLRRRPRRRRRRRRRHKTERYFHSWQPPVHLNEDLRDVQLLALERRIRASKCLLLFPVRKEDVDVMEHYFHQGYKRRDDHNNDHDDAYDEEYCNHDYPFEAVDYGGSAKELMYDLELKEHVDDDNDDDGYENYNNSNNNNNNNNNNTALDPLSATPAGQTTGDQQADDTYNDRMQDINLEEESHIRHHHHRQQQQRNKGTHMNGDSSNITPCPDSSSSTADDDIPVGSRPTAGAADSPEQQQQQQQQQQGVDQIITDVTANVTENISRFRRANIADGWDAGTTPEAMSDDLMLGLRDGFCGALSSFSSWVSTMVNLMRQGKIGQSFVGLLLGLQLPILAYRFGQHVAVYIFVWRARFESQRDARRGYGIRVAMDEQSEREASSASLDAQQHHQQQQQDRNMDQDEVPSVRAIVTALFIMALVTQCTSLSFYGDPEHQQIALSLLFSPLGVLARWRLSKYNTWRPTFPLGTCTANLLACALSGSLGSLLAGNPGPRESIVLQSIVAGFGGTMSSLATFVVEILAGIDPILFRFDGMIYAVLSIFWAMVICFLLSAAGDWADTIGNSSD